MDYGTPKVPAVAGATLVATGITLGQQIAMLVAILLLVLAAAVFIRGSWRKNKDVDEK